MVEAGERVVKVYIAGPMRGIPQFNFPEFDRVAARWRKAGWDVVNPADLDREIGFDGSDISKADEAFVKMAMERDLDALKTCDAIVLLDGWADSEGARHELMVATDLGLYVFNERDHRVALTLIRTPNTATETRVVDPSTGGAKGSKIARFDLIPADVLYQLAEHYGRGASKYEDRNWERGYPWSLSFAAMQRHAWAFWNGETTDPDSGSHHMLAVMFHAAALVRFTTAFPEKDDRQVKP